jgi:hypothetical protein
MRRRWSGTASLPVRQVTAHQGQCIASSTVRPYGGMFGHARRGAPSGDVNHQPSADRTCSKHFRRGVAVSDWTKTTSFPFGERKMLSV